MQQTTAQWRQNTTIEDAATWLRACRRVVTMTHAKPDGDAAGASLALVRTLRRIGCEAEAWFVGPDPRWFAEVCGDTPSRRFAPGHEMSPSDGRGEPAEVPDALIILDTGSWTQLSEVAPFIRRHHERAMVIDHHLHGDADAAPRMLLDTGAAATTVIVAQLAVNLLDLSSIAQLPADIAEPCYLGIATDTGWFRYANTKPRTLRVAADLIEAGARHSALFSMIEQRDGASRWRLLGRALSTLELLDGGRVAMMTLTLGDFRECGADRNDTGGFADKLLTIESVRVAVVVTEGEPVDGVPVTKASFRSKPGQDEVDVNAIAQVLGGGGHARASGAKMRLDLQSARRKITEAVS